jgi:hypothetical protein
MGAFCQPFLLLEGIDIDPLSGASLLARSCLTRYGPLTTTSPSQLPFPSIWILLTSPQHATPAWLIAEDSSSSSILFCNYTLHLTA